VSQRLLIDTIASSIDEAGEMFRFFPDAPLAKTVADPIMRERYYAAIAEQAKPDESQEKLAERQRRDFNRAIEGASKPSGSLLPREMGCVSYGFPEYSFRFRKRDTPGHL
jgi:hypothetical protein